jgi:CHAT domain-containing protein
MLASYQDEYFGNVIDILENYRSAGKDHLCIVPHAAFNYMPFHLLGEVGKPLADLWKITYLPNLGLIDRIGQRSEPSELNPIASVGLGFEQENEFGLSPLENAVAEAEKIAAIFNCTPIPDSQATPRAVIQAMKTSRRAHIASHGLHNLSGAVFQCIFLAPEDGNDGRLFAYEVFGANLHHLDLLTLSACETALGRFDPAGNLRGLPIAFLLAGVRTIVGTLWPVATLPCEKFFTTFYQQLNQNTPVLDAFYAAQRATKDEFNQYIDWGPFYLIGGW